jgi:hypothetical protein
MVRQHTFTFLGHKLTLHSSAHRWTLPTSWPLVLLNGATGTRDAFSLTFRSTFSNMVNIIGQVRHLPLTSYDRQDFNRCRIDSFNILVAFCISIRSRRRCCDSSSWLESAFRNQIMRILHDRQTISHHPSLPQIADDGSSGAVTTEQ